MDRGGGGDFGGGRSWGRGRLRRERGLGGRVGRARAGGGPQDVPGAGFASGDEAGLDAGHAPGACLTRILPPVPPRHAGRRLAAAGPAPVPALAPAARPPAVARAQAAARAPAARLLAPAAAARAAPHPLPPAGMVPPVHHHAAAALCRIPFLARPHCVSDVATGQHTSPPYCTICIAKAWGGNPAFLSGIASDDPEWSCRIRTLRLRCAEAEMHVFLRTTSAHFAHCAFPPPPLPSSHPLPPPPAPDPSHPPTPLRTRACAHARTAQALTEGGYRTMAPRAYHHVSPPPLRTWSGAWRLLVKRRGRGGRE
jgi:hypothetical protein